MWQPHISKAPRLYLTGPLAESITLDLPAETVRHVQVLRLQPGDALTIFNGDGGEYGATLLSLGKRAATVLIDDYRAREAEPSYHVCLAQGIAGSDKMDWMVEKAVELGAAGIVPLLTTRGVVRLAGDRASRRQAHWQALVSAACEQCGRNRLPTLAAPLGLKDWLASLPCAAAPGELRLLLSPRAARRFDSLPPRAPAGAVVLLIGPEGGLSDDEEGAAFAQGFSAISLGERILRAETAGLAFLAALAARWGGW